MNWLMDVGFMYRHGQDIGFGYLRLRYHRLRGRDIAGGRKDSSMLGGYSRGLGFIRFGYMLFSRYICVTRIVLESGLVVLITAWAGLCSGEGFGIGIYWRFWISELVCGNLICVTLMDCLIFKERTTWRFQNSYSRSTRACN
jgi:hypothetical protein